MGAPCWGWQRAAGCWRGSPLACCPHASQDYIELSRTILPNMAAWEGFPIYNAHMLRAFFILLAPGIPILAKVLAVALSAVGVVGFLFFWKQHRDNLELVYAGVLCLTIWIIPHAMIYDWALLLIPAILLWDHQPRLRRNWKAVYAILWLAILLSTPLTIAQRAVLPFAIQISLPALAWGLAMSYQLIGNAMTVEEPA